MTIKRAVEHFAFKFKNVWKPTQPDIDALTTIMKFVEDKHKQQIQDHHLFAKLYIMVYSQYLEKYKTTIFDDIPRKELTKTLNKPMIVFLERFTQRLNESELYSLFDDLGIKLEHPATITAEYKEKEINTLKNALNDKDSFNKFTGNVWDLETVKENLELQINNVINTL